METRRFKKIITFLILALFFMAASLSAELISLKQVKKLAPKLIKTEHRFLKNKLKSLERIRVSIEKDQKKYARKRKLSPEQQFQMQTLSKLGQSIKDRMTTLRYNVIRFGKKTVDDLVYERNNKKYIVGYIVHFKPKGFAIMARISELAPVRFLSFSGDYDQLKDSPFLQMVAESSYKAMDRLGYFDPQNMRNPAFRKNVTLKTFRKVYPYRKKDQTFTMDTLMSGNVTKWKDLIYQGPLVSLYEEVEPLLVTKWGQGSPWNAQTPLQDGQHTLVGCVAVAQGQLMKFWDHPVKGTGSRNGIGFNYFYEWDKMENTSDPYGAAALLLRHVGASVDMSYGLTGSGTSTEKCKDSLKDYFYYNPSTIVARADYTPGSWFKVIKDDIKEGRPVILKLRRIGGGHAAVADGYRMPDNKVHVNLGWYGGSDNYYDLDDVAHKYTDIGNNKAIIGIMPALQIIDIEIPRYRQPHEFWPPIIKKYFIQEKMKRRR